jgi:acyl-CoA thioester hydrolase
MKIRVYYEDTDAGGIVYHANYIKYCERARSELFFERGMMPYSDEQSGFVVRKLEADYTGMSRLGDLLEVKTRLLEMKRSSVLLKQKIFRGDQALFSMEIWLVYVVAGRPAHIPAELREVVDSLSC